MVTARSLGRAWGSVWVASTCSTSEVPIPNARAPNAPCVEVCESPQTMTRPGWVAPSSGPITWTMPWWRLPSGYRRIPVRRQFSISASSCRRPVSSAAAIPPSVGVLWSMVASVRSGRRTSRPASRSPSNACGVVTSWIRWRST